jgi:hypothetical protein
LWSCMQNMQRCGEMMTNKDLVSLFHVPVLILVRLISKYNCKVISTLILHLKFVPLARV